MNIFVYDDIFRLLKDFKYTATYATTKGKIYSLQSLTNIADTSKDKTMSGLVIVVDDKDSNQIITLLDAYYMCSSYKYNIPNNTDITVRKTIQCDTKMGKIECHTWFINKENEKLMERVRRGRLTNGLG